MRKKSDEKRQSILAIAYELFIANGFEKTSMAEISARMGGSKGTLYGYFVSKAELFAECVLDAADRHVGDIFSTLLDESLDFGTALQRFGEDVIRLFCSPELVALRRLMIAEAVRSETGPLFQKKLMARQDNVVAALAKAMDNGSLVQDDPVLAAVQLRALLEAEVFEPRLLCLCDPSLDEETIKAAAERAVRTFLRAYGGSNVAAVFSHLN